MTTAEKVLHTPGPWQCTENSFGCTALIVQSPDRTLAVSSLRRSAMDDEYLANARLIASAPEMLEALDQAPEMDCWPDMTRSELEESLHGYVYWFHEVAMPAMRKARGEQ